MRDKTIWVFNAGHAFAGNPKWLFLYLRDHHPEITCYWFCYRQGLVEKMRAMGFRACLYKSAEARKIGAQAGVYVVEQNKERFQDYFQGITVLNLWHGVTCKKLEHGVTRGYMERGVAVKHIRNESVYRQQLMLVTSPQQEEIFKSQCKVADENVVRAPYPRCFERSEICTFDHDLLTARGLGPDTKVAVYAPTFRDFDKSAFFSRALPDMEALVNVLEANDWLLVIKTHPQMEGDFQLEAMKRRYGSHQRLLFWDNDDDLYEIFDRVDFAIVDYSSIFFDMLACGVRRFARYAFDYGDKEHLRDFADDYMKMTCGSVCDSFEALLAEFERDEETDPVEIERVNKLVWSYAQDHSVEEIVLRALEHEVDLDAQLPTLFSFDVFDTLIRRKCGKPEAVFECVQEKLQHSELEFPPYLMMHYVDARRAAEASCRLFMKRTVESRGDERVEITFDMIFERLAATCGLDGRQVEALKKWELECERFVVEPVRGNVDEALGLAARGETVLLISEMYLPGAFIKELLAKADPRLAELPLFVSSETGRQKTSGGLFLDAYHSLDYRFDRWVHVGDSKKADVRAPKELGIEGCLRCEPVVKSRHAEALVKGVGSFDAALVSVMMKRSMPEGGTDAERFAWEYASLYFVPYVYWAVHHAVEQGFECLYFISRDGFHLKRIADAVIEECGLPLRTRYIHGSRKAWRVPSQIDCIDEDFFSSHGHFHGVFDYASLVEASLLDEGEFEAMFPSLTVLKDEEFIAEPDRLRAVEVLRDSSDYRAWLLERAAAERDVVVDYLRQEIDFSQRFAFVEYWGRGYTQTCHTRLMSLCDENAKGSAYYYARSIYPTEGDIVRFNLTDTVEPLIFAEALFANMPEGTVQGYRREGGRVVPVFDAVDCNEALFEALCDQLPRFAREFARLEFVDSGRSMRELHDFAVRYCNGHRTDPVFLKHIAPLKDSVAINGQAREFAPRLSASWLRGYLKKDGTSTKSLLMTVARFNPLARVAASKLEMWKRSR